MATGESHAAAALQQPSHPEAPTSNQPDSSVSPPTKRELATWLRKFRKTTEKIEEKAIAPGIFGVALADSIRYANVAISLTTEQGDSFIYGYVPIVIAKCGVFLKEKATDVEGIFRLNGSTKRIKDLQVTFDSPDRYGKGLDWTGYTVHDAANIFRRYLNQLPEPIVPLEFYEQFRDPLRSHQAQAVGDMEAKEQDVGGFDHDGVVSTYQRLITELPALNRQLLLYILDLLAVFASKSDLNRMNSANLAAIFQPGILSHPSHDMAPEEYRLSQDILIFLIENQDNFLFGMSGTAVDEKTVKDMENGPRPISSPKVAMGRSASNASGGADSLRKLGRRNSVSSRHSKGSNGGTSPATPGHPLTATKSGSGVHRSNTVPTKKSPALASARFQRYGNQGSPSLPTSTPPISATKASSPGNSLAAPASSPHTPSKPQPSTEDKAPTTVEQNLAANPHGSSKKKPSLQNLPASLVAPPSKVKSPVRERKISSLFTKSPILGPREMDNEQREGRQPNKLRKKQKVPGSANESGRSSQNSFHAESASHQTFHTPLASPDLMSHAESDPLVGPKPTLSTTSATPTAEDPPEGPHSIPAPTQNVSSQDPASGALRPPRSPSSSVHSRSSVSEIETGAEEVAAKAKARRHRWRFSTSAGKNEDSPLAPPPLIGQNVGARGSNSSIGSSSHRPRKSFTGDSQQTQQTAATTDTSSGRTAQPQRSSQESAEQGKDPGSDVEKKGLFGKWKAKIIQSKEERKEREAEKEKEKERERERTRSPPRGDVERTSEHRHSLSAFANGHHPFAAHRGRSSERPRENTLPSVTEAASPSGGESETGAGVSADANPESGTGTDSMSPVPPTPITAIKTVPKTTGDSDAGTSSLHPPQEQQGQQDLASALPPHSSRAEDKIEARAQGSLKDDSKETGR